MDDQNHIAQFLAGDPETVELVRSWIRAAFIPYRERLAQDFEDLEQEILVHLIGSLRDGRFQGRSQLKTYVATCVHYKSIDRLRAARRREWVAIDELELPSAGTSVLDEVVGSERVRVALRVLEEMPEPCRELWRWMSEGMSYRELARRLGVTEGTLRARVLRCRRRALESRQRLFPEFDGNKTPSSTTK